MHTRSVLKTVLPLVDVGSGGISGFFNARGLGGVSQGNFGTGGLNKPLGTSSPKNFFNFLDFFFFQLSGVNTLNNLVIGSPGIVS